MKWPFWRPSGWRAVSKRLQALREQLAAADLPGLLVTDERNRRYLSGFSGEGMLLITAAAAVLFTDFRYWEQAAAEAPAYERFLVGEGGQALGEAVSRLQLRLLGFEAEEVTVSRLGRWQESWGRETTLKPVQGLVEGLRQRKDPGEIQLMRRAGEVAVTALEETLAGIRVGQTEREISLELEYRMRRLGAEGPAFPFIVASGPRSALPHAVPTERRLAPGDLLTIDCGAVAAGYCSDVTRTVAVVGLDERWQTIYHLVYEAQALGLSLVRIGASAAAVDAEVRAFFDREGLAGHFGHGLGHGVGLAVHEGPRLSPREEAKLAAGMVVTVEPGLYFEGEGGVRIEDTVAVGSGGAEILTRGSKELRIVG